MPFHFKHNSYESFVRQVQFTLIQLNLYGFHKIRDIEFIETYKHDEFRDGLNEEKLNAIKRRKMTSENKSEPLISTATLEQELKAMKSSISTLKFEVLRQEQSLKGIIEGLIKFSNF